MRRFLIALMTLGGCARNAPPPAAPVDAPPTAPPPAPTAPVPSRRLPETPPVLLAVDPTPGGAVVVHLPVEELRSTAEAWVTVGELEPRERWASLGVDPDEPWWVLPDGGAAVRATPVEVVLAVENECGGTFAWAVTLDAPLPPGTTGIAALRGTPPTSWRAAPTAPRLAPDAARAVLRGLADEGAAHVEVGLAPDGDGWVGRTAWLLDATPDDSEEPVFRVVDARVTADGGALVRETRVEATSLGPSLPYAARDLDGDGHVEVLVSDGCAEVALGRRGPVAANLSRCCGC